MSMIEAAARKWEEAGFVPFWKEEKYPTSQSKPAPTDTDGSSAPQVQQHPLSLGSYMNPDAKVTELPVSDVSDRHEDTTPASVPSPPRAPAKPLCDEMGDQPQGLQSLIDQARHH